MDAGNSRPENDPVEEVEKLLNEYKKVININYATKFNFSQDPECLDIEQFESDIKTEWEIRSKIFLYLAMNSLILNADAVLGTNPRPKTYSELNQKGETDDPHNN